jgi:hypothetical protein
MLSSFSWPERPSHVRKAIHAALRPLLVLMP